MSLNGKMVLITGAAKRIGRSLSLAVAQAGADVVIHYGNSRSDAESTRMEIESLGRKAFLLQADLMDAEQVDNLMPRAREYGPVFALVNNAAIFEPLNWKKSSMDDMNRHLKVNLIAPFLLSQAFAQSLSPEESGRIINMLGFFA